MMELVYYNIIIIILSCFFMPALSIKSLYGHEKMFN